MSRLLSIAGLACLIATGVWADQETARPPKENAARRPRAAARAAANPNRYRRAAPGRRLANPLNPAQRFLQMTPEERERLMERANPQQRARMRAALARYNSLSPFARERLFRQYQVLKGLPLEQQALISRQFRAFNQLPPERRWPVGQELLRLHRMPPDKRAARLESAGFAARYSPAERQILTDLSLNLPPEYPLGGK